MGYRSLRVPLDLERHRQLVRVGEEVDPPEMAEIQRRAFYAGAPALLFEK
jgi:3-polyprenyl-4-hydroxybenzoate decarboxylase